MHRTRHEVAYRNMNVQDTPFAALVTDLVRTLEKFKVPVREKNELLAILRPMKDDIVAPGRAQRWTRAVRCIPSLSRGFS